VRLARLAPPPLRKWRRWRRQRLRSRRQTSRRKRRGRACRWLYRAPECAGKGAINPSWLPPMLRCGWEGASRAGDGGRAELGDGVVAPDDAGLGAVGPVVAERLGWAVNEYPPPIIVVVGEEYDSVAADGMAGEDAIGLFTKRSARRAQSGGKSYADGVVLPPECS
jgi:hypothetical protein